jgi:hypothetical protein
VSKAAESEQRALVGNAADPEQVAQGSAKQKRIADRLAANWNAVMDTQTGRAALYDLLSQCGVWEGGFTAERAHYNEGRRNIGFYVLAKLNKQPEAYSLMMREAQKEKDS